MKEKDGKGAGGNERIEEAHDIKEQQNEGYREEGR